MLQRYIARRYIYWFAILLLGLAILIFTIDFIELMRRNADKDGVSTAVTAWMTLLKLPNMLERLLPFAALFASLTTLSAMTRSSELISARAAGVSIWKILAPLIAASLLIGVVQVAAINPLAGLALEHYDQLQEQYFENNSQPSTDRSDIWLRQAEKKQAEDAGGYSVIHARSMHGQSMALRYVTFFRFNAQNQYQQRIDARRAVLGDGQWQLQNALVTLRDAAPVRHTALMIPASITRAELQNNFAATASLSLWELPGYINTLQAAGFSAKRQYAQLISLVLLPFVLAATTVLAAIFALQLPRKGQKMRMLGFTILTGFSYYILNDFSRALAVNGRLPLELGVAAPTLILAMLCLQVLIRREEC